MKNNELTAVKAEIPSLDGLPQPVVEYVMGLVAENVALRVAVDGVNSELYGKGFEVLGWHLNGDTEPLDTWFEDNDWDPETPSTEAAIDEIKAQGVEEFAADRQKYMETLHPINLKSYAEEIDHLVTQLYSFAANLRAGGKG